VPSERLEKVSLGYTGGQALLLPQRSKKAVGGVESNEPTMDHRRGKSRIQLRVLQNTNRRNESGRKDNDMTIHAILRQRILGARDYSGPSFIPPEAITRIAIRAAIKREKALVHKRTATKQPD
jgi:hypothetical protein